MRSRRWLPFALGALIGGIGGIGLFLWPGPAADVVGGPAPLPRLYRAPHYQLVDQLGRAVSSDSFRGRVRVVVLLDPYCTAMCPLTASKVMNLERALEQRHLAGSVQFVAFDVNDLTGPRAMRSFLVQEGIDPNGSWLAYLTGPASVVHEVVTGGYHIDYRHASAAARSAAPPSAYQARLQNAVAERAGAPFDIAHQDPLLIVGRSGWVRALYGSASTAPTALVVADVRRLVRAAR